MELTPLLTLARTQLGAPGLSKKRALEYLAELAAQHAPHLNSQTLFENLIARERLGSTGLGAGVAIPHARIAPDSEPVGVLLRLCEPVDFHAHDGLGVDLLFALFVPENQCQQHLDTLAYLAERLSDPARLSRMRHAADNSSLYQAMLD